MHGSKFVINGYYKQTYVVTQTLFSKITLMKTELNLIRWDRKLKDMKTMRALKMRDTTAALPNQKRN